jgi:hypothetical protein
MDKRHFTVVIGSKEHGLYISSKPSSAAKKAVSKLCAANKSKKVEFCLREITQGSKKKTYGPYVGEMKKLKKPIELKGRVIRHEIKLHLKKEKRSTIKTAKKMRGGENGENINVIMQRIREFQIQVFNLIETNQYKTILDAIFNGEFMLCDLLNLSRGNENQIIFIKIIDHINSLRTNENKNNYFFIICYIIAHITYYNILDYLILIIGLDKLIEIVYRINYGDVFDRIITNIVDLNINRINQQKINNIKASIFKKLISYYYEKESLVEFTEVLKKLFSIQDISFNLEEIVIFFTNNPIQSFKLFQFLLDNKAQFIHFIQVLKPYIARIRFTLSVRSIIGSQEIQEQLFSNM